jgi:nucleoid DNA-binding protein
MVFSDLVSRIAKRIKANKITVLKVLEGMLLEISEATAIGDEVHLPTLGKFYLTKLEHRTSKMRDVVGDDEEKKVVFTPLKQGSMFVPFKSLKKGKILNEIAGINNLYRTCINSPFKELGEDTEGDKIDAS